MSEEALDAFCARVGRDLKALRIARGLSQADVAEKIGVTRQTLSKVETGDVSGVAMRTIFSLAIFYKAPKKMFRFEAECSQTSDPVMEGCEV